MEKEKISKHVLIKRIRNLCFTAILCLALIGAPVFMMFQPGDTRDNPIPGSVASGMTYETEGGGTELSQEAASALEENRDNSQWQTEQTDASVQEQSRESQDGLSTDAADETKSGQKKSGGGKTGDKKDKNSPVKDSDGEQAPESEINTAGEGDPEGEESPTDDIYFTTSIIDGETVTEYEYAFTITHLKKELTPKKITVTVNGEEVRNFDGSVLLQEGSNAITVAVTYEKEDTSLLEASKDYTVFVDTTTLVISTDLQDQTVNTPYFTFTASALLRGEETDLTVSLNGQKTEPREEHTYRVTLNEGTNTIVLNAQKEEYTVNKTYHILFQAEESYSIYTTLKNETVNTPEYTFQAMILKGTSKSRLTVIVNGTTLTGSDGTYTASLNSGTNTIRLKATDTGQVSINQTYTVRYVPLATPDTEPVMVSINVSDGMEISGSTFTLNIKATDYQGNKIYYDGMTVNLNGKLLQYRWSGEFVSYVLDLQTGENQLSVRLTDREGRYKDFYYGLECTYIEKGTPIGNATVSVDAAVIHLPAFLDGVNVEVCYGDTVADVLDKALKAAGYDYKYTGATDSGFYLTDIVKSNITDGCYIDDALVAEIEEDGLMMNREPGTDNFIYQTDSLGQLDFSQGSGWMYSVNGTYESYGMSDYAPKDGDVIRVRYTLAYGKDIGAYQAAGGSYGIKDHYDNQY